MERLLANHERDAQVPPRSAFFAGILLILLLASCTQNLCEKGHTWSNSTCTEPAVCEICNTIGAYGGHKWSGKTCFSPSVCNICGEVGSLGEHAWSGGTCIEASMCSVCGEVGSLGEHAWSGGTCVNPAVCEICGEEGGLGNHSLGGWNMAKEETFLEPGLQERYCAICGERFEKKLEASSYKSGASLPLSYFDGLWLFERGIIYEKTKAVALADAIDSPAGTTYITDAVTGTPIETSSVTSQANAAVTISGGKISFWGVEGRITSIEALESSYDLEPIRDYDNWNRVIDSPELTEENGWQGYTGDPSFFGDLYALRMEGYFTSTYGGEDGELIENIWYVDTDDDGYARMCWYRVYLLDTKRPTPGGRAWHVEELKVVKCYWQLSSKE